MLGCSGVSPWADTVVCRKVVFGAKSLLSPAHMLTIASAHQGRTKGFLGSCRHKASASSNFDLSKVALSSSGLLSSSSGRGNKFLNRSV